MATGLDPRSHIAASPLLGRLPSAAIDQLAGEAEALGLRGGETLFEAEDPADALYLVTLGRLRIELPADVPQEVAAGDVVGEIGALTGEPRMATAVAMRDTLLLRIGAPAIRRVMAANDEAERALLRHIVQRLRAPSRNRRTSRTRAIRLLAQSRAGFLHHCRPGDPAAMDRLARLVAGRAVGLVLGGGGARGFAHIGLLRALAEAGLPVDLVGGTSMGAFIAALHARGMEPQAIRDCCHEVFVAKNHLNDWVWPRVSLIRGRKFLKKLKQVFGDTRIEELALPFYCVSTNLTRGQPQVHRDGELATWIGTSMAVPGIAPPVVYRGELLADGAVVNSVPVEAMQALDRGPVIACDVGAPGELALPGVDGPEPEALLKARHRGKGPALSDILMRMTSMTSDLRLEENAGQADLFLRMPVADVGMFDWASLDTTIETGYRHACQVLADAAQEWPGNEPAPPFHAPRPADVPHKT